MQWRNSDVTRFIVLASSVKTKEVKVIEFHKISDYLKSRDLNLRCDGFSLNNCNVDSYGGPGNTQGNPLIETEVLQAIVKNHTDLI